MTKHSWTIDNGLVRDLRFAVRGLRRTPSFTIVAIASLALGLALTTTMVSVVNAYLVRSLPYPEADRLYHVRYAPPGPWEPRGMTGMDWPSVRDVVEFPIASAGESFYLDDGGYAVSLRGLRVMQGFAEGLGVTAAIGRRFTEQDFAPGSERVALIGHALWRERFGSDPGFVGRTIRTEPESRPGTFETFRIVGVLPSGFYFGRESRTPVDLMVPQATPVRAYLVRLRDRVPPAAAEQRLTEAARRAATSPLPDDWTGVHLESAHERWVGQLRPVLFGVTVAVSLVLVIVCANVAVLMLLRSLQRQREVAVRLALGSGWRHIIRMLLAESSLIAAAALIAGTGITALVLDTLAPMIEAQLGRPAPGASGIALDTTVLLVVVGVSLAATISLALAPLTSWGRGLTNALRQDGRVATQGRLMRRLRSGLIVFEVAGSLVLLVGCGLMIRSVGRMMTTELGFNPDGLITSRIALRPRDPADGGAYRPVFERFASRVSADTSMPVVFSSWPPFVPPPAHTIEAQPGEAGITGGVVSVSAGYFSTFGIELRRGREFTAGEAAADAPVAVVSETLAGRLWPAGGALGGRVREMEQTPGGVTAGPWRTVVGISGDVRQTYDDGDQADFYKPKVPDGRFATFYVRTDRPAPMLFESLQRAAAEVDRDAVVNPARSVAGDDKARAGSRFLSLLLTGCAVIASFLAMLGIYGVTAYAVQQRHREIAIRLALGAPERAIIRLFVRDGSLVLLAGTAAGLIGAAALSRVLRHQVFGVGSFDAWTHVAACALLLAAGFTAVFRAARTAASIRPISSLDC